ncbi:hypothetical protein Acsp03_42680 [Actinomadura sp. NBRC 104412]|uniref:actinodefensin-associated protein B n=1 Tax=Actinomadura sp. NBRC 104412 TaxID=3032203 RepID=UPI00249F9B06|nr:actinodefensin-associated protein B [Actinomadura sp. NBRC 104412]GLZ06802.1 hypothetical protein Acsp03_42680 [Actinomadura sp. NBRC 104412]
MRTAPGVTFTRLPQGGAVLVNGTTLAMTECGEPEAALIEHLLTRGMPAPGAAADAVPPAAALRHLGEQLVESGWLLDDRRP